MEQRRKNITLIVILGLLIVCSLALALVKESGSGSLVDKTLFSIGDPAAVDRIEIQSKGSEVSLFKQDETWMLNDTLKAEQNLVTVLLSLLRDVEVTRRAPKASESSIRNQLLEDGFKVSVYGKDELVQTFYAAGNDTKTVSYMMSSEDQQPYIMSIPGYGSYVAGIFEIPFNDWRDRLILSSTWRSLQMLDLQYAEFPQYSFKIQFNREFLEVADMKDVDTTRMMSYIEGFNYLQADRFIDAGQQPQYDSLLQTPSTVSIQIRDINKVSSKSLRFYPLLPNDPMMLAYVEEDQQMVLFETDRIQNLFAVKDDFRLK